MKIEDLFAKRERVIYRLYQELRESRLAFSLKEMSQKLHLSRATLIRYIETFNEDALQQGLGLFFQIEDESIYFQKEASLLHTEWVAYLSQFSMKYQILLYLFEKEEFTIQALSQYLVMSEASLNRQLATLNQLLQDFHISIRNGRLKGSELQIRYFYYQLFLQTTTVTALNKKAIFRQASHYLVLFERFIEGTFNAYQSFQLSLWIGITQKRMRVLDADFADVIQLMTPYIGQKWYQELRDFSLTLYQYQPTTVREGEVMSLFAFLISQSIVPPQKVEQILAFGGPIREATTWCYQTIREKVGHPLPIQEDILYFLNQLLANLYFFNGTLQSSHPIISYAKRDAQTLLSAVLEQFYQPAFSRLVFTLEEEEVCLLASLFDYLGQVQPAVVRIGFLSYQSPILADPMLFHLQRAFERKHTVVVESFSESVEYDLIITDMPLPEEESSRYYFFHSLLSESDKVALTELIAHLQLEKERGAHRILEATSFPMERR